jgi:hypothetical protein
MTKPTDNFQIFVQARQFMLADECLRRHKDYVNLSRPAVVTSAFATELFLKCLRAMEGPTIPTGHDLSMLYKGLRADTRQRIEASWDAHAASMAKRFDAMETLVGEKIPRDLPTALEQCRNAFTLMRYIYEDPTAGVFYIGDLARMLHDEIITRQPVWAHSSGMSKLKELPAIPLE